MNKGKTSSATILFVLSNDFGELATALYLVRGQPFHAVFCMPEVLYAVQGDAIPQRVHRYRSARDVLSVVDQLNPDIVFLFSGYLYAVNNVFDIDTVEALVRDLQKRHCRVVTSDPFLGLMSDVTASHFSDNHPLKHWLAEHFGRIGRVFSGVTHLYLTDTRTLTHCANVSFFNKKMIVGREGLARCSTHAAQWPGIQPGTKRSLFILSLEDYAAQANRHGRNQFNDVLFRLLQEAASLGRQPVLIGPPIAIDALEMRSHLVERLVMIPFVGHDVFLSLLLDAEYAFYWNVISNSILYRVINDLPVFFFDPGHLQHAIEPVFTRAMKLYYADAEMPYLDPAEELSARKLDLLATQQRGAFSPAISRFRKLPDPERMVREIIDGKQK